MQKYEHRRACSTDEPKKMSRTSLGNFKSRSQSNALTDQAGHSFSQLAKPQNDSSSLYIGQR